MEACNDKNQLDFLLLFFMSFFWFSVVILLFGSFNAKVLFAWTLNILCRLFTVVFDKNQYNKSAYPMWTKKKKSLNKRESNDKEGKYCP